MRIVSLLLDVVVLVHVVAGFVGLVAFWIPVFARKGGRAHVRAGRVYAYAAYVVTLSAVVASAGRIGSYVNQGVGFTESPDLYGMAVFLGYLGVVTLANVRHGVRVLATRRAPESIRTPFHLGLAWACLACSAGVIVLAVAAWSDSSSILLGLSPVGIFTGSNLLRYMRNPGARPMGWLYSHLGSMLGGGIAFHTAFAVFGVQRVIAFELPGTLAVLPWLLPTIVGVPAIIAWQRRYRRLVPHRRHRGAPSAELWNGVAVRCYRRALAITTTRGRRVCRTVTVSPCAARTSGRRRYTWGLSSGAPPRSTTPRPSTHRRIIARLTLPRFTTLPVRRCRLPSAAVRLITRPAPCTVE